MTNHNQLVNSALGFTQRIALNVARNFSQKVPTYAPNQKKNTASKVSVTNCLGRVMINFQDAENVAKIVTNVLNAKEPIRKKMENVVEGVYQMKNTYKKKISASVALAFIM